jgi:uncharacterized protein (DUF362 family)
VLEDVPGIDQIEAGVGERQPLGDGYDPSIDDLIGPEGIVEISADYVASSRPIIVREEKAAATPKVEYPGIGAKGIGDDLMKPVRLRYVVAVEALVESLNQVHAARAPSVGFLEGTGRGGLEACATGALLCCLVYLAPDRPWIRHCEELPIKAEFLPEIVTAFRCEEPGYPQEAPFNPDEAFPEYPGETSQARNVVYSAVRETFRLSGLDTGRFGSPGWNPLGELLSPGETVLVKPNLVKESHPRDPAGWQYVLTHGSVIRAVTDYIWLAIGPTGSVYLADAPQTDSSWDGIVSVLGLDSIRDHYLRRGLSFHLVDLRQEEWRAEAGVIVERRKLAGDPNGAVAFDLGSASEFADHGGGGRYYGADYDESTVNHHHTGGRHEYLIAGSAVKADAVFSIPKLKTHKKAGVTVSLKNLVGINADKNWLPHHTEGDPRRGGDEHPAPGPLHRLERRGAALLRRVALSFPFVGPRIMQRARRIGTKVFGDTETVVRSGNWWGNDTIWRMCLDLNKVLLYGNPDGSLREPAVRNRKRHFVLVDGIVAGEGRGPMNPDPVHAGLLIFGTDAPSVDATCARLIGLDPEKIPIVRQAFQVREYPLTSHLLDSVRVTSNVPEWSRRLLEIDSSSTFHFRPHFGWVGRIEMPSPVHARAPRAEAPSASASGGR